MAALILRRSSIYRNLIRATPIARRFSSSAPSSPRPWLLMQDYNVDPEVEHSEDDELYHLPAVDDGVRKLLYNFYSLADGKVTSYEKRRAKDAVVVGSSHGWLALYKRRLVNNNSGFKMFLYNPVSQRQVNLPSVKSLPSSLPDDFDASLQEEYLPKKVILSCSPEDNKDEECRAIMSYGPEDRLAYCCPGSSKHWIPMGDLYHENEPINLDLIRRGYTTNTWYPRIYEDFVYCMTKKQLLCTTKFDNFECWDIGDPLYPKMNWKKTPGDGLDYEKDNYPYPLGDHLLRKNGLCRTWKYLVYAEKSNRRFLVRRTVMEKLGSKVGLNWYTSGDGPYQTVGFDVHEIIVDDNDPAANKGGELRYIKGSLDGMAFFIGSTGHGFVVEEELPKMIKNNVKPNCIYFTDPRELTPSQQDDESHGGHDLGIFNYINREFYTFFVYPCDLRCLRRLYPTPTWFTPSP